MSIDIDNLTEDELIKLNHRIVERLKFLESMHTHHEMMQFSPGEKVSFEPPGRGRQIGTLVKYNKKTVRYRIRAEMECVTASIEQSQRYPRQW